MIDSLVVPCTCCGAAIGQPCDRGLGKKSAAHQSRNKAARRARLLTPKPTPAVDIVTVRTDTQASILADPDRASLKRIAWAYGCAKRGSVEEDALRMILIERSQKEIP